MFLLSPMEQMRQMAVSQRKPSPQAQPLILPEDLNIFWAVLDEKGWGAEHEMTAASQEGYTFLSFVLFYCPEVMHHALAMIKAHPDQSPLINRPDPYGHHEGWTPLHWAARLFQGQAWVPDLLALGADPIVTCANAGTPQESSPAALGLLMTAFNPRIQQFFAEDKEASIVAAKTLIKAGSNLKETDDENMTTLHRAVTCAPHLVSLILQQPDGQATINAVDIFGHSVLSRALINNPYLAHDLLDCGADPWMPLTRQDRAFTSAVDIVHQVLSGEIGQIGLTRGRWQDILTHMKKVKQP